MYLKMLVSIATSAYERYGTGHIFIEKFFKNIMKQTYKNIEIVISDQSKNNLIKEIADKYKHLLNIIYLDFEDKDSGNPPNINNALQNCTGEIIKILFMDDYFFSEDALETIVNEFKNNPDRKWLANNFVHVDENSPNKYFNYATAHYNEKLLFGLNTLGGPSNITIRKEIIDNNILFNNELLWLCDCEFYHRLYKNYGHPIYVKKTLTVSLYSRSSVSEKVKKNTAEGKYKKTERELMEHDKDIIINKLKHKTLYI